MIVSVECDFRIFQVYSLKEKRSVLKRILTRVKQKYNVSIAEADYQDQWQLTQISVVAVGSSKLSAEKEMQGCLSFLDSFPEWERVNITYEWL